MESRKKLTPSHGSSHSTCFIEFIPLLAFAFAPFRIRFCKPVSIYITHVTANFTADPPTKSVPETRHPPLSRTESTLTAFIPAIFVSQSASIYFLSHHNYAYCYTLSRNNGPTGTPCEGCTLPNSIPERMFQDLVLVRASPRRGY